MKDMMSFLVGASAIATVWLAHDLITSAVKARVVPVAQLTQEHCIKRVAEVWVGGKGKHDLTVALALCKEGEQLAGRVLTTLNKERPRLNDGRVK